MITVAGEALMDVLADPSGTLTALPGGGPFNVARAIARLGGSCQFLGTLSEDAFGCELRAALEDAGIGIVVDTPTAAPTTLAIAQLDAGGAADYRFYLDGTSAAQLLPTDIPPDVFHGTRAIALGGLSILIEPTASTLLALVVQAPPDTTVLLDPNGRPRAIRELASYRGAVNAFLRRVDIVKASVDDLRLLDRCADVRDVARSLLALGPRAVLVTDGPSPISIHTAGGECSVPVPSTEVVDTIGAGDAFVAALLSWWTSHSLERKDASDVDKLREAASAAARVAVAACTVRGAGLPDGLDRSNARFAKWWDQPTASSVS